MIECQRWLKRKSLKCIHRNESNYIFPFIFIRIPKHRCFFIFWKYLFISSMDIFVTTKLICPTHGSTFIYNQHDPMRWMQHVIIHICGNSNKGSEFHIKFELALEVTFFHLLLSLSLSLYFGGLSQSFEHQIPIKCHLIQVTVISIKYIVWI